jgi:acyl carrier protein
MTPSFEAGNLRAMPSYDESLRGACELLTRHVDPKRVISASDRIQDDLGLDSLSVMEFASDVEAKFGVSIPPDMYDRIATVDDVAKAVVTLAGPSR